MTDSAPLTNEQLRLTEPVYAETVDTGGMFTGRVSVHFDPAPGVAKPYLAVCSGSFGGGKQGRRATRDEAVAAAWAFHEELHG